MVPDDDQAMALPWASVMVIMVLLNEAFTCATPDAMFLRSRRRTRPPAAVASLPIRSPFEAAQHATDTTRLSVLRRGFLLAGNGFGRTLAGAGVGVGALAADRQALAVTQTAIAAEIHQALDVDGNLAPQIAFDHVIAVDHFTDLQDFLVGQLRHPTLHRDVDLRHDVLGVLLADAMDVLERDDDALVGRNIHACNSGHDFTPVPAGAAAPDRVCQFRVPGRALQAIKRRPPRYLGAGIVRT